MSIKQQVLEGIQSREITCKQTVFCDFHGLKIEFVFGRPEICSIIPDHWIRDCHPEIRVYMDHEPRWEIDCDSNCRLAFDGETELAIQRDFVGRDSGEIKVVLGDDIHNGFFNALRWIIPRRLLNLDRLILHSSVMIGKNGKASVFLGHSGAGKSTIHSLAKGRTVLGDDMNLLYLDKGFPMIEAAGIGGRTVDSFDAYQVEAFYWLVKDGQTFTKPMEMGESALKFLASCPNLFLNYRDEGISSKIMEMGIRMSREVPFYYLHFDKSQEFLNYVEQS